MPKVGLLWRKEWDPVDVAAAGTQACKLSGVFAAFAGLGVEAEPVVFTEDDSATVRDQLLALDGVLVWVNPIEQGLDRSVLDELLREAAAAGVWVSAHPDVILKLATKEVLVDAQHLSWGSDTRLYRTSNELRADLPARLASGQVLVLKQRRGMGGAGVWRVELAGDSIVRVQHAASGSPVEELPLDEFLDRCEAYFDHDGLMVEQPYQQRLADGMIRAYLSHASVVGFTHQYPRGLMPPGPDDRPTGKVFELATAAKYTRLRGLLETEWVPALQEIFAVETHELPAIWDADFLFGPKTEGGDDTYVLCEINASSTFSFPEHAMPDVARAALARIGELASQPLRRASARPDSSS
jgi:hypothetical protein